MSQTTSSPLSYLIVMAKAKQTKAAPKNKVRTTPIKKGTPKAIAATFIRKGVVQDPKKVEKEIIAKRKVENEVIYQQQQVERSEMLTKIAKLERIILQDQVAKQFSATHIPEGVIEDLMEHKNEHYLGRIANTPLYCDGGGQITCFTCKRKCTTYCMQCYWFFELPKMRGVHKKCMQLHIASKEKRNPIIPFHRKGRVEEVIAEEDDEDEE